MKKNQKLTENLFYNKGLNENLYDSIPTAKLVKIKKLGTPVTMSGPRPYVFTHGEFHNAFASTTSTYPHYPNTTKREGDPICDSFRVHIHQELFIACIADGCNWGERPREASNRGKDAFVRSIEANIATVKNFRDLGPLMMAALDESHMAILAEKNDIWMAGTTTLLGGVCVKLADPAVGKEWAFMGVTVGDCKTFMFSSKEKTVVDLTEGNRMNITDPRDPGGRIGPYVGGGDADVRNLMLFHVFLEEGDILFFLSDGVHDNLDPQTLGKDPSDFGLDGKDWDDVDLLAGTKVKTVWCCFEFVDSLKDFRSLCVRLCKTLY
eukprot:TRINITY_DN22241_c0_g1_i2.p1 TRINITY_DN22241_c0_g1~~TRINITY_DN22241_c0_g1_i2.p1  ORF type:complete len:322 (-),score=51.18 TRINITY_DN22241_c0_g1_i2:275-1240(-)